MSAHIQFDHEVQRVKLDAWTVMLTIVVFGLIGALYFVTRQSTESVLGIYNTDTLVINSLQKRVDDLNRTLINQQNELTEYEAAKEAAQKKAAEKAKRISFQTSEVSCLADNIYHEAAYEPENGQLAVATVTMNRVADPNYPKSICGVVYERHVAKNNGKIVCMFSWTCKPPRYSIHPSIYQKVLAMARAVYFKHERNDEVQDAVLYHASYINAPNWADPQNLVATIGQHLFYKQ